MAHDQMTSTTTKKSKVPWAVASRVADELLREFESACERIAVAGSIRRREVLVGDVELLCVPRFKPDLLGDAGESLLLRRIEDLRRRCRFVETLRNGERWKTFAMLPAGDVRLLVDLFIVAPDEWGVAMLLRTGPAAFSRRAVMPAVSGGLLKPGLSVAEHRICRGRALDDADNVLYAGELLNTPNERDVFDQALVCPWVEPDQRK
jgi:DNA polymerase/3'-5' exonuclease PolX